MSLLQLEGNIAEPDTTVSDLIERVESLESRIDQLEGDQQLVKRDAVVMLLSLLTESLRHVASGKMEMPTVPSVSNGNGQDARWQAIKSRLAPKLQACVDILLLQGPMLRTQIAAAMKMDYSNCNKNVIGALIRQGVAIENGRQIMLKQL